MGFVVAVDGPAGSGKGTITKKIAKEMFDKNYAQPIGPIREYII